MQVTRFQIRAACPAWNGREGSDSIRDYVKGLLSAEGLAANSTEELHGLSEWQQEENEKPNKGQYPERASVRALSIQERKKSEEAEARRLNNLAPHEETSGQISKSDVVPSERKRANRVSGRAGTTPTSPPPSSFRASPPPVPAAQVSGHKRSHADAADTEDGDCGSLPKRRNLAQASVISIPSPRLPSTGLPNSPTAHHCSDLGGSQPMAQGFDEEPWARQEALSPIANAPGTRPKIKWTAISLSQRGIPNLFDRTNRSKTLQPPKRRREYQG